MAGDLGSALVRASVQCAGGAAVGMFFECGGDAGPDTLWGACLTDLEGFEKFDPHDPHQLGRLGEELAARYLACSGYTELERNWRTPYGEADLVCRKGDEVILVEVKTRYGADVLPEEAVDRKKMLRYRNITLDYLRGHEEDEQVRFDVMAVNVESPSEARVRHLMGVCLWEG